MPEEKITDAQIFELIKTLISEEEVTVAADTPLIGDSSLLDSMKLVELCLALEDRAAELGFEFDWTSEEAMSRSRSMFRTAGSLSDEFFSQMDGKR